MASTKTNTASVATNNTSTENFERKFVAEYMAQLNAQKGPKVSLASRIANGVVNITADAVENSRVGFGEIKAAWEIAETRSEMRYAARHARFAHELALLAKSAQ